MSMSAEGSGLAKPLAWFLGLGSVGKFLVLVLAPLVVGFIGILLAKGTATRPDASEAVAALVSAVLGVTGVHIGHHARRQRHMRGSSQQESTGFPWGAVWFVLASIGIGAVAFWLSQVWSISFPAIATLFVAGVGVATVHLGHDARKTSWKVDTWLGLLLAVVGLVVGIGIAIVVPESAEGWAVVMTGLITLGGAYAGHFGG